METTTADPAATTDMPITDRVGSSKNSYFPGLDGLRAIAFLLVFGVHLTPPILASYRPLTGGYLGIDVFFVLSGFLITTILVSEFARTGSIKLGKFYLRRSIRLLPAVLLFVAAVFVLTATESMFKADATDIRRNALASLSYFYNWISIYSTNRGHNLFFVGHLWSLSVEEQFYFIFPVSLFFGLRSGAHRAGVAAEGRSYPLSKEELASAISRVMKFLVAGLIVSNVLITLIGFVFSSNVSYERAMWGTDTRASGFIIGAIPAILRLAYPKIYGRIVPLLKLLAPPAVIGLALAALYFPERPSTMPFAGGLFVVDVLVAIVVLAAVERTWKPISFVLEFPALRWIGKVSYGAYVVHYMLVWRFYYRNERFFTVPGGAFIPTLAITLAIAAVSFYGIEQPLARKLRKKWNL